MRILVTGSRDWTNKESIRDVLARFKNSGKSMTLIHGGARGADSLAAEVAHEMHWEVIAYLANWMEYGRAAGPIRNEQMLLEGKPDLVIAFHEKLSESKGTADMVRRAQKADIPLIIITK